jgi:hypothetical protein
MKRVISSFEAEFGKIKYLLPSLCPSEYLRLLQTENKDFLFFESSENKDFPVFGSIIKLLVK